MSKKKLVLLLLLAFTLALGCRIDAGRKRIVVGFAQVGAESAWRIANSESIIAEAKKRGIELKFVDCQQQQENQIKAIRSFIADKVDVIGFSPVVTTGWDEVLREAKRAKIPVILVDRGVDCQDDSLWVTLIGSDFVEEGRKAARWLAEKMKGKANIVELQGTIGSAPTIDRKKGFEEIIAQYPEMKIIRSKAGDFTRSMGKEVMEEFLEAEGRNIDALFSHNDDMAIGAIQAIEAYGLRPGTDIIIVSVDAIRAAFEAMIEGKLNCTVECNPLIGRQFFDAVEEIVAGKPVPKRVVVDEEVFPQEVAKEFLPIRRY
ncbi:MAG: ABC transporter substrate-binding protein [Firmicutes bacterium]|nr:ABC transporter substrate-binding protein [Bacillota bacterium]